MNTITEFKALIYSCYQENKIEELISLYNCLTDCFDAPWTIIKHSDNLQEKLEYLQSFSQNDYKFYNEKRLRRIKVSAVDIYLMPKNKRLALIPYIENYIEELLGEQILVIDKVRFDPYQEDSLYFFIQDNKSELDKHILSLYEARKIDLFKLLDYAKVEKNLYESFYLLSKRNKVVDYWKNIWGKYQSYSSENYGIVEHLIL